MARALLDVGPLSAWEPGSVVLFPRGYGPYADTQRLVYASTVRLRGQLEELGESGVEAGGDDSDDSAAAQSGQTGRGQQRIGRWHSARQCGSGGGQLDLMEKRCGGARHSGTGRAQQSALSSTVRERGDGTAVNLSLCSVVQCSVVGTFSTLAPCPTF